MVTHDRDEAYQLCDSLLLLDQGRCAGWPEGHGTSSSALVTCRASQAHGNKNISRIERAGRTQRIRRVDWKQAGSSQRTGPWAVPSQAVGHQGT
ncbi:MAG: hypothetical protein ACLTW9_25080 [Enterocloster sp.]